MTKSSLENYREEINKTMFTTVKTSLGLVLTGVSLLEIVCDELQGSSKNFLKDIQITCNN